MSAKSLLKFLHDNIDPDQLVADYMALSKSERVKYAIEITRLLKEDESSGAVTLTVKYPDGSPFNNSTSTAA